MEVPNIYQVALLHRRFCRVFLATFLVAVPLGFTLGFVEGFTQTTYKPLETAFGALYLGCLLYLLVLMLRIMSAIKLSLVWRVAIVAMMLPCGLLRFVAGVIVLSHARNIIEGAGCRVGFLGASTETLEKLRADTLVVTQ